MRSRPVIEKIPERVSELIEGKLDQVNTCTLASLGKAWVENLRENVKLVDFKKHSVYQFKNKFKGRVFFLVGNGPSLKYNVDVLVDKVKEKNGILMSSSHGLKYLLSKNIRPDFVVVVDSKPKAVNFLDVGDESKDLKLLMCSEVHPNTIRKWKGSMWFFTGHPKESEVPIHKELNAISDFNDMVSCGGNVMGGAYYIADGMGADKIVFVGMDLANGFNYKTNYASGEVDTGNIDPEDTIYDIKEKERGMAFGDNFITCDISGRGTFTLLRMGNYKYWFERRSLDRPMEHINATEGGILGAHLEGNLKSIKQMPLAEV